MSTAEFKTMLTLYTPFRILEEKIDRRRGKTSGSKFFSAILEAGVPSDQEEKIIILMMSAVPSKATNQDSRTANAPKTPQLHNTNHNHQATKGG